MRSLNHAKALGLIVFIYASWTHSVFYRNVPVHQWQGDRSWFGTDCNLKDRVESKVIKVFNNIFYFGNLRWLLLLPNQFKPLEIYPKIRFHAVENQLCFLKLRFSKFYSVVILIKRVLRLNMANIVIFNNLKYFLLLVGFECLIMKNFEAFSDHIIDMHEPQIYCVELCLPFIRNG